MRFKILLSVFLGSLFFWPALMPAVAQEAHKDRQAMQQGMTKMHAQMQEIQQTQDVKKREKLLDEHMRSMQEHMQHMHDMMGSGGMQGGGTMGSMHAPGKGDKTAQMPMMDRQEKLEQRMDMMQMMMEQMMQHDAAVQDKRYRTGKP